jgi:hypothetical protein
MLGRAAVPAAQAGEAQLQVAGDESLKKNSVRTTPWHSGTSAATG